MVLWKINFEFKLDGHPEWRPSDGTIVGTDDTTSAWNKFKSETVGTEAEVEGSGTLTVGTIAMPVPASLTKVKIIDARLVSIAFISEVHYLDLPALGVAGILNLLKDEDSPPPPE